MESQNTEFIIISQEDIAQQNQARETEYDSQGIVVSDKELVKEMKRDDSGTADMINMMQKILMIMDEMQISFKEHCTKIEEMVEDNCKEKKKSIVA